MIVLLSKKFDHDDQDFEIYVKYDTEVKQPIEVKHILMHTHGRSYPTGNLFNKYFKEAIEKLVAETDWETIRKEFQDSYADNIEASIKLLPPAIGSALRPFLIHGGPVKELTH